MFLCLGSLLIHSDLRRISQEICQNSCCFFYGCGFCHCAWLEHTGSRFCFFVSCFYQIWRIKHSALLHLEAEDMEGYCLSKLGFEPTSSGSWPFHLIAMEKYKGMKFRSLFIPQKSKSVPWNPSFKSALKRKQKWSYKRDGLWSGARWHESEKGNVSEQEGWFLITVVFLQGVSLYIHQLTHCLSVSFLTATEFAVIRKIKVAKYFFIPISSQNTQFSFDAQTK